ncbi:hypothetical protein IMG5_135620 [Ichthyophthirius multifiliis]|uniref:Palmitoyltransferase n=1 Tax=Ichthyophthirius multifiliis TaxID=5932 RepID=G0QWV4_ICHMU|nr:hypothetical protein IMG5_135620 [Ichthyophthirius multifiliis]EGR30296.1 hypothetical protein IMG5_135620 [Ichthyophthirius multifiliis]|eukprot:XP_004031883.1 hypothetical protein IMG5_135620 [Ichthyophthirius multifiliis]
MRVCFRLYKLYSRKYIRSRVFRVFYFIKNKIKIKIKKCRIKNIPLQNINKQVKYCYKCSLNPWKPDRVHNCKYCKKCIFRMNHHCDWINNCVRIKNHKYYLLFIIYILIIYFFGLILIFLNEILYYLSNDFLKVLFDITFTKILCLIYSALKLNCS